MVWIFNIRKIFFPIAFFCILLSYNAFSQDPFTIRKDAVRRSQRCFTITSDQNNKAGAVWFKEKLDLSRPLELNFVIYMGDKDANGADGIAFVMHNDPLDTLGVGAFGEEGGGLGFSRHTSQGSGKIFPSVAIEFDTWNNGANSYDIAEDHTAVVYNGDVHNYTQLIKDKDGNMVRQTPIKPKPPFSVQNVENDECYHYQIIWDPTTKELKLFTDGHIVFTFTDDIINNVFGGVTELRYGFTGSTGGSRNEQTICLFGGNTPPLAVDDYATTLAQVPVDVFITENDFDPDGDQLLKSVILEYPKNGIANTIGVDTIEYIPNATFVGRDSLRYFTCDVNSIKCYAKCDTATVYIDVECPPATNILSAQISPNEKCEDAKADNGVAKAYFMSGAPTDGLIAHWSMDDGVGANSAKDHANTNDGTLFNFAQPWVNTELGGALDFDGTNDYVAIDNFNYNTSNNTEVTVAMWVKTTNSGNQVLASFDRDSYWRLEINGNGGGPGQIGWDVRTDAGIKDLGSTKKIDDGQWHHVVGVFNNGSQRIFIDGTLDASTTSGTKFGNGSTRFGFLGVGSNASTFNGSKNPANYFDGNMDDVRIYGKALTASEISKLYNAGNPAIPLANPNITFLWYRGTSLKAMADYTGSTISGLTEGVYTVVSVNNITGCVSNPDQVTIHRTQQSPEAVIWQVAPFTSCGLADGILQSAVKVLVDGSLITSGYNFTWYENDFILTGDVVAVGPVAGSLNAEKYAVVVTNQSTGCDTIISSEVASNITYPVVSANANAHITTCFDLTAGKASANVGGTTTGYLFNWYKGDVEKSVADYTGSSINNLPPGDYTVTATNVVTQCVSDPVVITIEDQTEPPLIVSTVVAHQQSCDPANPTGAVSASVNVGGTPTSSGYSFYWYKGANTSVPALSEFTGNSASNCGGPSSSTTGDIWLEAECGTVGSLWNTKNDKETSQGQYVEIKSGNNSVSSAPTSSSSRVSYTFNVPAGNYEVWARIYTPDGGDNSFYVRTDGNSWKTWHTPIKTSWQWAKVTHNSNPTTFNLSFSGNHTLDIAYREDGSKLDKIYITKSGNPPYTGTQGIAVSGLSAGVYRVLAIDNTTGCSATADVTIDDAREFPVASIADKSDQTYCGTAANGAARATVVGNVNDYEFYWFPGIVNNPDTTTVTAGYKSTQISGLLANDYTVLVSHKEFRCSSTPVFVEVEDKTINPVPSTSVIAEQTACDVSKVNGALSGTVNATTYGGTSTDTLSYIFDWYKGVVTLSTLPGSPTITEATPEKLTAGDYTLVVTNDTTNCKSVAYTYLPENKIKPIIDVNTIGVAHANRCSDPWGSKIVVSADNGKNSTDGYIFRWVRADNSVVQASTTETLSNIPPASYMVTVTNPLGCVANNSETVKVKDIAPKPSASLTAYNNNICDPAINPPNGIIISTGFSGPATNYTFGWFVTNTSGAQVSTLSTPIISANGDTVTALPSNTYALLLTDKATDCAITKYATINTKTPVKPVVDTLFTKATNYCYAGAANGEVQFQIVGGAKPMPYNSSVQRTYTFSLYTGATATGTALATNNTGLFTNLNIGKYTVVLEDLYTHCKSAAKTIDILQDVGGEIKFESHVPVTGCSGIDGELSISASSDNNSSPTGSGFAFTWYYAGSVVPKAAGDTENLFASERKGIMAGYYEVRVTDNHSQCTVEEVFLLPIADPPTVAIIDTTGSNQCTPGNGTAKVNIVKNPASPLGLENYTVEIHKGNMVSTGSFVTDWRPPAGPTVATHVFEDLEAGEYLAIINAGTCYGMQKVFNINQNSPPTALTISEDIPDFSCNTTGTGQLSVSAVGGDGNTTGFTYEWFVGPDATGTSIATIASTNADLSAGVYTVAVTDINGQATGCISTATYILENNPKDIKITALDLTPSNQCLPDGNGEAFVTEISEDGTAINSTAFARYDFELFDNSLVTFSPANTGDGTATNPYNSLIPETYNIQATNLDTDCKSDIKELIIEDNSQNPVVDIALIQPDFSCDGANPTGALQASAEDAVDGVNTNFTFSWYVGSTVPTSPPPPMSNTANTSNDLLNGEYTVVVEDTDGAGKNCITTRTATLIQSRRNIDLELSVQDQTVCAPAVGEISIDQVTETDSYNGSQNQPVNTYSFELFDAGMNSMDVNAANAVNNNQFTSLLPGTYLVRGTSTTTDNCTSLPFEAKIKDISKNPNVGITELNKQYSNSTAPATWTGELEAMVSVHKNNPLDSLTSGFTYGYAWYEASDYNTGSEISTANNVSKLDSGLYVLEVTNLVTNCKNTTNYFLEKVIMNPVLAYQVSPQTICLPTGSVSLDNITVNGVPANQGDFIFTLYTDTYPSLVADTLDGASVTPAQLFDSLSSEKNYYIEAFEKNLLITSEVTQIEVPNTSTLPMMNLNQALSKDQTNCDPNTNQNGALAVDVYEYDYTQGNYEYQWYEGQTTDVSTALTDSTTQYIRGLSSGYYSVKVRNTDTNCEATSFFFVNQTLRYPNVIVSSTPSVNCGEDNGNGIVTGYISNNTSTYRLDWFEGATAAGTPDFVGKTWRDLDPGTYTVLATDLVNPACISAPKSIDVDDDSVNPQVTIFEDAPLSNCDPKRPNGQLSAMVNGRIDGYKFVWYDSDDRIIKIGPTVSELSAGNYRVEVLDLTTSCVGTAEHEISEDFKIVPTPEILINSSLTDCQYPDGEAEAAVQGNIANYYFTWYDEKGKTLPSPTPNHILGGLKAGNYAVSSMDRETGCMSEPVSFTIKDETFEPIFTISATPTICNEDKGALVITYNDFDTAPDRIIWYNAATKEIIGENMEVLDLPAGIYSYEVYGSNNCSTVGDFTITSDLNVYNGITPNGDGDNDIFEIGCIEDFPVNRVKIYNRAGTLVYEASGYDNQTVFFDGHGNRGLYLSGSELPDGTYFYIIEKTKGTKPFTGYLELVR